MKPQGCNTMRQTLDGVPIDEIAIRRIQAHAPDDGLYVAFSGGKDSVVILDLVKRSGVPFDAHYNLTTADPPEVVYFVRRFPEVQFHKPRDKDGKFMSIWRLIHKKGMPPRRNARFCCEVMKEQGGKGRTVVTGVRWAESANRSKRGLYEGCYKDGNKHYLNPIIDWTTADVWHYIRSRGLDYCSLYDEGFTRVGCVLCPMSRKTDRDIERWPGIARLWERAVKATFKPGGAWDTEEDYWQWWLDRNTSSRKDELPMLFGEEDG
jgi:phosphoadenosine phosphosulfate reductase